MKKIPLTQGKYAIVDDEDYDKINSWKWYAHKDHKNGNFYAYRNETYASGKRKSVFMHREIFCTSSEMKIDHINGNGLDNRKENLRECNSSQNGANIQIGRRNNKSGYKGVCFKNRPKKWVAQITYRKKVYALGYYDNPIDAAKAYDKAAIRLHGEFAITNFGEE